MNGTARLYAAFGPGIDPIFFDQVSCIGNEERLFDCPNRGLEIHSCNHYQDVAVDCRPAGKHNSDLIVTNDARIILSLCQWRG